jgi:nucleotide-binding universal stress UspA family protein
MVRSILVGTDGSATASIAVAQAITLAQAVGARLQVVCAYEPVTAGPRGVGHLQAPGFTAWPMTGREDALTVLEAARSDAVAAGVTDVETFARVGDAADAIIDVAEEQGTDLIMVGHKGMTGATRFLLGSVPNRVSHHAPCSVLIVRTT